MIKAIITILILWQPIIALAQSNANDPNAKTQWRYGYIINSKNDTVYGNLKIGRKFLGYDFQKKLQFKYQSGADSLFTPNHIFGFGFFDTISSKVVNTNSYIALENTMAQVDTNIVRNRRYFFHVVNNGKCKIFGFTGIYNTNGMFAVLGGAVGGIIVTAIDNDEGYCIQRNGSDLYPIKKDGFKKDMVEFFWNCPFMLQKIKTKKYTVENWEDMVNDFNENGCK